MSKHFDSAKIVKEFEDFIQRNVKYFERRVNEFGHDIDLSFFIGKSFSSETGYYRLQWNHRVFLYSKKFREQYLYDSLDIIFDEFENYSGENIDWLKDALYKKLLTKAHKKAWDNKLYGSLVYDLVKHGSSQKNAIEFVSAISGKTQTIIRDSFYENNRMIKKYNMPLLGSSPMDKIDAFIKGNKKAISGASKQPKFSKSVDALEKLKASYDEIFIKRKIFIDEAMQKIKKMKKADSRQSNLA